MPKTQAAIPVKPCNSFHPGHNIHWIHARHGSDEGELPVVGLFVHNNWLHFTSGGIIYSRWNHNGPAIQWLLDNFPHLTVMFDKRWKILRITPRASRKAESFFYLACEPSSCGVVTRPKGANPV